MAARFAKPVSDDQEASLRSTAVPTNTKATTDWGIRLWEEWASNRPRDGSSNHVPASTPLLQMLVQDLSYWMGKFALEVRKQDGKEYPPKSLYALVCCFKRYFEQHGVHNINPLSTTDNAVFGEFRRTLDAEMKRLHGCGLRASSRKAEPITPDEEALLWSGGQFGTHNAKVILNTVYYYNCKVFGLRSFDEHRNLMCSQYKKGLDDQKRVYLEYTDFGSKTNPGGLKHMKVQNKAIRQYENPEDEEHCVVNIFVKYLTWIPSRDDHFFFRPKADDGSGVPKFASQPVGRNKLAQIIPEMCRAAGIPGRKTGHSGKVTCATVLHQQDFSDQLIKERTGHRSLESLHQYKRTGTDQQFEVSMALLPSVAKVPELKHKTKESPKLEVGKENVRPIPKKTVSKLSTIHQEFVSKQSTLHQEVNELDDDDDFQPMKKKKKFQPEDVQAMFPKKNLCS